MASSLLLGYKQATGAVGGEGGGERRKTHTSFLALVEPVSSSVSPPIIAALERVGKQEGYPTVHYGSIKGFLSTTGSRLVDVNRLHINPSLIACTCVLLAIDKSATIPCVL